MVTQLLGDRFIFTSLDLAEEISFELPKKRQLTNEHYVEADPNSPNICCIRLAVCFSRQVRIHIVRRATLSTKCLVRSCSQ